MPYVFMLENTDVERDKHQKRKRNTEYETEELAEKENEDQQNIDYNQPSPSTSQERKIRQIEYCKRNRSNTSVQSVKKLFAESVQAKLSICVKDARNKCKILK